MKTLTGFTLIELMLTVALIGIILTVALPNYQGIMKQSARATAQADLMAFAAAMERHKAAVYTYAGAARAAGDTGSPRVFQAHPPATETVALKEYDLTIESLTGNGLSYTLAATPVPGGTLAKDGVLYLFSDGRKAWDKNNNGTLELTEYCWRC
jgi:type IV pilus assembly protein PilE